jgi:hypothetical protein
MAYGRSNCAFIPTLGVLFRPVPEVGETSGISIIRLSDISNNFAPIKIERVTMGLSPNPIQPMMMFLRRIFNDLRTVLLSRQLQ